MNNPLLSNNNKNQNSYFNNEKLIYLLTQCPQVCFTMHLPTEIRWSGVSLQTEMKIIAFFNLVSS